MILRVSWNLFSIHRLSIKNTYKKIHQAKHRLTYHTSAVMAEENNQVPTASADDVAEKLSAIKLKKIEDEVAASFILVDIGNFFAINLNK